VSASTSASTPTTPNAALEALDAELDRDDYDTQMGGSDGDLACMTVASRHAGLSEEVYCDGRSYFWKWGQTIAAVDNPKAAAAKVSYFLSAGPRHHD
jgi:hypothetical protein